MTEFEHHAHPEDFSGDRANQGQPSFAHGDYPSSALEINSDPLPGENEGQPVISVWNFKSPSDFGLDDSSESENDPQSVVPVAEIAAPEPIRSLFRPLWTVGQAHAPFADVSLEDDLGVRIQSPESETPKWRVWARESLGIARDVALALAVAILIGVFVIQPVKVEGTSMLPRLHDGERIFINRFIYNFKKIERGDIVVFYYPKDPGKNFIKRVIGLPGDEITISNGKLRINGSLVPENYLSKDYTTNISAPHTWVVEPHHYFVMGDNRDASNDSRSWGYVPEMYIYGKAVFRYWPLSEAGGIGDDPADLKPLKELGRQTKADSDEE